jgi:hypothetical protein
MDGGGIFIRGDTTLNLTNSTISGNTATYSQTAGQGGGGIFQLQGSKAKITNTTISGNRTRGAGDGIHATNSAFMVIRNSTIAPDSIVARRTSTLIRVKNSVLSGCFSKTSEGRGIISLGHNISRYRCHLTQPTDQPNTRPLLGPLSNNGGPTDTRALLEGSSAIDKGANTGCPATDQRGRARPKDGNGDGRARCDLGAFEKQRP